MRVDRDAEELEPLQYDPLQAEYLDVGAVGQQILADEYRVDKVSRPPQPRELLYALARLSRVRYGRSAADVARLRCAESVHNAIVKLARHGIIVDGFSDGRALVYYRSRYGSVYLQEV